MPYALTYTWIQWLTEGSINESLSANNVYFPSIGNSTNAFRHHATHIIACRFSLLSKITGRNFVCLTSYIFWYIIQSFSQLDSIGNGGVYINIKIIKRVFRIVIQFVNIVYEYLTEITSTIIVILIAVKGIKHLRTILLPRCNVRLMWHNFDIFHEIIIVIKVVEWNKSFHTGCTEPMVIWDWFFQITQPQPFIMYFRMTRTTQYHFGTETSTDNIISDEVIHESNNIDQGIYSSVSNHLPIFTHTHINTPSTNEKGQHTLVCNYGENDKILKRHPRHTMGIIKPQTKH